jgi:hypothetical protein
VGKPKEAEDFPHLFPAGSDVLENLQLQEKYFIVNFQQGGLI